jgi:hypothetical protein
MPKDFKDLENVKKMLKASTDARERQMLKKKLQQIQKDSVRTSKVKGKTFELKGKPKTVSSPKPNFKLSSGGKLVKRTSSQATKYMSKALVKTGAKTIAKRGALATLGPVGAVASALMTEKVGEEGEADLVTKIDKEAAEKSPKKEVVKKLSEDSLKKAFKKSKPKEKPKDIGSKSIDLVKDVAKQEEKETGFKFDTSMIEDAALGLLPVLVGSLLGGTDGALAGVKAGAKGIQTKYEIERAEGAAKTAKELKEKELGIESKEQQSKEKFRTAQADQFASQVYLNQAKAVAASAKARSEQGKLFIKGIGTARTPSDAEALKVFASGHNKSISLINDIKDLGQNIGVFDRKKIAKIQSKLALLVGSLRIDVVGPGAFTDSEREFIKEIVGDPSKVTGAESIEFAKLESLLETKEQAFIDQINLRTKEGYLGGSKEDMDERSEYERLKEKYRK